MYAVFGSFMVMFSSWRLICKYAFLLTCLLVLVHGRMGLRIRVIVGRRIWLLDIGLMDNIWMSLVGIRGRYILVLCYPLLVIGSLIREPLVLLILHLLVLVNCRGHRYMILRFGATRIYGRQVVVLGVERERRWVLGYGGKVSVYSLFFASPILASGLMISPVALVRMLPREVVLVGV